MEVLLALVERRGTVVPQEVLLGIVWAGTHLAPGALARAVSVIRTTLGDDSRQARYVETIPKRGYRLIAPVEEIVAASPGSAATPPLLARPRRRWRSLAPRPPWPLSLRLRWPTGSADPRPGRRVPVRGAPDDARDARVERDRVHTLLARGRARPIVG